MKLEDYKLFFITIGLIGVLLIASPALSGVLSDLPDGNQFSELYILGPERMTENYPFNIAPFQNYSVYVGVKNNLGSSAYYVLYVKFGNETDLLSKTTHEKPSSIQPVYEYRFIIQDGLNWEGLLNFSVSNSTVYGNNSQINTLQINGLSFNVDKPAMLDSNSTRFKYYLMFELWLYNSQLDEILYNQRFVHLQLNHTVTM
jgi:uncharacterized membrane protein